MPNQMDQRGHSIARKSDGRDQPPLFEATSCYIYIDFYMTCANDMSYVQGLERTW